MRFYCRCLQFLDCFWKSVWDNRIFPKWQPNKKPNFPIKLWTPWIQAFIQFHSLLRVTIPKAPSTLYNCLKLTGVSGHALKQTFVKSSHLLDLFTFCAFDQIWLQRFYLFRDCDNSIALELEQVNQYIFGRKTLKNYFICKSNLIWTLHLFYRRNTMCKNIDTENCNSHTDMFFQWRVTIEF